MKNLTPVGDEEVRHCRSASALKSGRSKYPPAKPGALEMGPLKGADSRAFTDAPRMAHSP